MIIGAAELGLEFSDQRLVIETQVAGVVAREAADVDGRGEDAPFARLDGADVVGLDVGGIRDLVDRQHLSLTFGTQLFPDIWHRRFCKASGAPAATAETVSIMETDRPGCDQKWRTLGVRFLAGARLVSLAPGFGRASRGSPPTNRFNGFLLRRPASR